MATPRRPLSHILGKLHPDLNPEVEIVGGRVRVNGVVVTNPGSLVRSSDSIVVTPLRRLKGEDKLSRGLERLGLEQLGAKQARLDCFDGQVLVDIGASTGGFTVALLARGAAKVYAVDVGYGQLLGSLRQDSRVVNLERLNASDVNQSYVPDLVDGIVVDVSYSPLRAIIGDVTRGLELAPRAWLVALVKPMFELQAASLPTSKDELSQAVDEARRAVIGAGWEVSTIVESPLRGNNGAIEYFVLAQMVKSGGVDPPQHHDPGQPGRDRD